MVKNPKWSPGKDTAPAERGWGHCLHPICPETMGTNKPYSHGPTPGWDGVEADSFLNMELVWFGTLPVPLLERCRTLGTSSCQGCGWAQHSPSQGPACELLIIAKAAMIPRAAVAGHVPQLHEPLSASASSQPACHYPRFTGEETEAQKGEAACPREPVGVSRTPRASSGTPPPGAPPHVRRLHGPPTAGGAALPSTSPPPQGPACPQGAEGSPTLPTSAIIPCLRKAATILHDPRSPQSPRRCMELSRPCSSPVGLRAGPWVLWENTPPLASLDWGNGFLPSSLTRLRPTLSALSTGSLSTYNSIWFWFWGAEGGEGLGRS